LIENSDPSSSHLNQWDRKYNKAAFIGDDSGKLVDNYYKKNFMGRLLLLQEAVHDGDLFDVKFT